MHGISGWGEREGRGRAGARRTRLRRHRQQPRGPLEARRLLRAAQAAQRVRDGGVDGLRGGRGMCEAGRGCQGADNTQHIRAGLVRPRPAPRARAASPAASRAARAPSACARLTRAWWAPARAAPRRARSPRRCAFPAPQTALSAGDGRGGKRHEGDGEGRAGAGGEGGRSLACLVLGVQQSRVHERSLQRRTHHRLVLRRVGQRLAHSLAGAGRAAERRGAGGSANGAARRRRRRRGAPPAPSPGCWCPARSTGRDPAAPAWGAPCGARREAGGAPAEASRAADAPSPAAREHT